jgi:hypothetical protein
MSSLNQDQAYLKGEIEYREKVIAALRDTVREREAELITSNDEADAQIHHMPRRVFVGHDFVWQEMPAEDEIVPESLPVVDIKIIDAVLPNYEADRQPA